MIGILDENKPTPEEEFADEIKAYEAEEAAKEKEPEAEEPAAVEAEGESNVEETEAKAVDEQESDTQPEVENKEETPEEEASEAEEVEADSGQERKVPVGALTAARQKSAELQRQLDEMNGQVQTLMQMYQPQAQGEQQQEAAPNPEEDPIGAIEWTKKQMEAVKVQQEQQAQREQQTQQEEQLAQIYRRNAQEFAKQAPDFPDAYSHLMQSRVNELRLQGLDDIAITNSIKAEEQHLAISSLQQNINPAARIYDLAKARGYTGKKAAAATPPAAQPIDPVVEEKKKSAALNTRGKPPKTPVTDKELANLKGAAFDSAWSKIFGPDEKKFV